MSFIDEDFIPDTGALFNFGEIGSEELISKIWIKNDPVKEFSCGDQFVVLITMSGRVFAYGKNDWGQLGLGDVKATNNPYCIKSLKSSGEKALHVGCGRCHTLISTESQRLFACGSNTDGQLGLDPSIRSVEEPTEVTCWDAGPIKQLSAGGEFSAALTENGDLYVWGSNSEGQLGMNSSDDDGLWQPSKLSFFPSPVSNMSCGAYHMGAITGGMLYMWGEASDGKLGLSNSLKANQNFPQKVGSIPSPVKQVACGNTHSLCLTSSGEVYVWGYGESGQLGLGPSEICMDKPTLLKLPRKIVNCYGDNADLMEKFSFIATGERHTAVINVNGLIFTFGDGRHGKLGNLEGSISYSNHMWPTLIEKLSNDLWIEGVACGGCHSVVLVRQRRIDEQLDEIQSSYLSSTIRTNNDSILRDNSPGRTRRHRRNNLDKDIGSESRNLPILKPSTMPTISRGSEFAKKRKDNSPITEENIYDVKTTLLKSTPNEKLDNDITSSTAEDLDKIKSEMEKYVGDAHGGLNGVHSQEQSFNDKVDNFVMLMDETYDDPLVQDRDPTDEIVRKRPRKKRKIKSVEARNNPNEGFDQSVWNEDLHSGDEKSGTSKIEEKNNFEISNPEVTKMGCRSGCGGRQESGTCSFI